MASASSSRSGAGAGEDEWTEEEQGEGTEHVRLLVLDLLPPLLIGQKLRTYTLHFYRASALSVFVVVAVVVVVVFVSKKLLNYGIIKLLNSCVYSFVFRLSFCFKA